ncbi:hypothetical protein HanHA300_Chr05g0177111 [Helianthus annuus]|nr:hypothetical protein HanHA300_Chr05g0177111 [Helianthus annuus]
MDPLHGHAYLEFTAGTDTVSYCRKLRRMHVGAHVAIDWDALEAIGEMPRVRYFIPVDSPWHRLIELAHMPTYRELLVDFLSTFAFHPPRADQPRAQPHAPPTPPEISFRLASVWRAMTLAGFAVHSGVYLLEEIATDVYIEGLVVVDRPTLLGLWEVVVGADTWEHPKAKGRISHVDDHCTGDRAHFHTVWPSTSPPPITGRSADFLYGGAYVTVISRSLGLLPEADPHLLPAIEPTRMGFQTLWGMKLIMRFNILGEWFKTHGCHVFVPKELPEHFDPVYPPPDHAGVVQEPPVDIDGAAMPQPPPPHGASQFP